MNVMPAVNALDQYRRVKTDAAVATADRHRLIQMLLEGALERIASAKGHLLRGDVARKGELIGKAIGIVAGLRQSLNHGQGGELAGNLDRLYGYMERRLLQANLGSDSRALDEVASLLGEIKTAWDAIAGP